MKYKLNYLSLNLKDMQNENRMIFSLQDKWKKEIQERVFISIFDCFGLKNIKEANSVLITPDNS